MADSSSQNSDSSNSSSQYFQNSHPGQMSSYPQQQLPFNYQIQQNFPQQFPLNIPPGFNFPQQFPLNSAPTGHPQQNPYNFPQQFYFNSPGGPIYPQQIPLDSPSGSIIPEHSSQIPLAAVADVDEEVRDPSTKAIWTHDEDTQLVKAWYNTSTDSMIGNEQKKKEFWLKIVDHYNVYRPKGTIQRTPTQVKNRYYKILPDLNKWAGIYNNFWSNRASGQGDDDVLEAAKKCWRNADPKSKNFKFLHIWKGIQECEKWTPQQRPQNPNKKSKTSETDSPSSGDTGTRTRPMGQQRAKRLAKQKAKVTSTSNEEGWKHLQETMVRQLSLQEEQLKLQHIEFCSKDTSGMSEAELYNFNMMAAEIKAKYGWK